MSAKLLQSKVTITKCKPAIILVIITIRMEHPCYNSAFFLPRYVAEKFLGSSRF